MIQFRDKSGEFSLSLATWASSRALTQKKKKKKKMHFRAVAARVSIVNFNNKHTR